MKPQNTDKLDVQATIEQARATLEGSREITKRSRELINKINGLVEPRPADDPI